MNMRALCIVLASCILACTSGPEARTASGGAGAGTSTIGSGTGGAGVTGSGAGGSSVIAPGDASASSDGSIVSRDAACVSDAQVGEQVPVDLYFMVDKTG